MVCCTCCSIDATEEPSESSRCPKLGRLVNHGDTARLRNARMKVLPGPVLALYATRVIYAGDQVLYDYGIQVPWKNQVSYSVLELWQYCSQLAKQETN